MRYLITFLMLIGIAQAQSTYHIRYDTVKIGKGSGGPGELVVESSTKDSTSGVLVNIGGGKTQFKRIRAISASQFVVGTDTITITGASGGGGSGTLTNLTATNNTGQTWTITNPTTTPNLSLALTKAAVGLSNVDNTSDASKPISTLTQTALNGKADTGYINLVIIDSGTGQRIYYVRNDSLHLKKIGNTYGLTWATGSDSTLNGTVDSLLFTSKLARQKVADSLGAIIATKQGSLTLTTTGSSGAATLIGNTINIPQYSGGTTYSAGYGLSLASTTFSADTFAVTSFLSRKKLADSLGALISAGGGGTVTSVGAGYGITGGTITNTGTHGVDTFAITTWARETKRIDSLAALKQGNITLTTTGSSGAATLIGNTLNIPQYTGGGGVSDGDKGDITVSSSGTVWTIDNTVVTEAKLSIADNTTGNASTSAHGFLKKLDNSTSSYMDGTGLWSIPIGGSFRKILADLGSATKYESLGLGRAFVNTTASLTDGRVIFIAVYIKESTTITGVEWYQPTQGVFTADNNNRLGLYSYSGGTLTLVASCADDANLWKPSSATYNQKAFTTPYSASPGTYFIAALYNNSAQTTAPSIAQYTLNQNAVLASAGLSNSAKYSCFVAGNDLPSSQAMTGTSASNALWYFTLY